MQSFKGIHILVGLLGLMAFVLTGQYLAIVLHGLNATPDVPRLLYRTSHLYLMWGSLLNLVIGMQYAVVATPSGRVVQIISSLLLVASPVLMLAGFFFESPTGSLDRVLTDWGNYFALGAIVLYVAVNVKTARDRTG